MNKTQKYIAAGFVFSLIILLIIWIFSGAEVFTKTQVLVERKDELFGWTEKVWEDKFIWGLDLSLILAFSSAVISGLLLFLFRSKKR
jgi:uncharacterized integral membrane protein